MAPMHDCGIVEAFHEPRSAAVPAASCGGVSPPARTPVGTPGALAGEDAGEEACATSAEQFMVPMRDSGIMETLQEPDLLFNQAELRDLEPSVVVQSAVVRVASGAAFASGAAHKIAKQVAHVCLDLFRVFAGFEPFDGHIEF